MRSPDWLVPAVGTDQQAETAVIAVHDDPPLIAVFHSPNRLQSFDLAGQKIGQGPDLSGVGRLLRAAPGWLAAATDRQILLCDLKRRTERRLDVSLVQLTHLVIRPDDFGLALVQERDRVGRLTASSRWVWRHELRWPIEELAIGQQSFMGATTHGGELLVYDPAGESTCAFRFDPTDPPLIVDAPAGSPTGVAWLTLARRAQFLRGHDLGGKVLWERTIPWEGWSISRLDRLVVATSADGHALACDGSGSILAQGASAGDPKDVFYLDRAGQPLRLSRRGVHIISAGLDGRVRWRSVVDQTIGPLAAGTSGVAVLLGRSLAWFGSEPAADG
jgi:hypothetical protein